MKNTTLITFLIAAFATFTSPANAAKVDKSGEGTLDIFVPCAGEMVNIRYQLHALFTFTKNNKTWTIDGEVSVRQFRGETTTYNYVGITFEQTSNFRKSLLNMMGNHTFTINACVKGIPKSACGGCARIHFKVRQTVTFRFKAPDTVNVELDNPTVSCEPCA